MFWCTLWCSFWWWRSWVLLFRLLFMIKLLLLCLLWLLRSWDDSLFALSMNFMISEAVESRRSLELFFLDSRWWSRSSLSMRVDEDDDDCLCCCSSSSRRNPSARFLVSLNFKKCCITRLSSSLFTIVHFISRFPWGSYLSKSDRNNAKGDDEEMRKKDKKNHENY
jgi:hypothetical protein